MPLQSILYCISECDSNQGTDTEQNPLIGLNTLQCIPTHSIHTVVVKKYQSAPNMRIIY